MSADQPAPRPDTGSTGRERMLSALRRPGSRGQATAAVLLAVVGFAAVVQWQSTEREDDYANTRQEDLVQILNSLALASERTEQEIAQLEQTRASLRSNTDSRRAALDQAQQQVDVLGILAGTVPAVGPGIRITVEDEAHAVGTNIILNALEELRSAGAEAIEINDSARVVAQTAISQGDNGIVVDEQELTPPYVIDVIGESHTLATSMEFTGGFIETVEGPAVGGEVVVEEMDNVEIATTREAPQPEYAEPAEEQ